MNELRYIHYGENKTFDVVAVARGEALEIRLA